MKQNTLSAHTVQTPADPETNLHIDADAVGGYARAIRSQADNLGDATSDAAGIDTGLDTATRQEFAEESDINNILGKYGMQQATRPLKWGETIDYTMDLQQAKTALAAVKSANFNIPEELRNKYPDWQAILNGTESGAYQHDLQELVQRKQAKAEAEEKAKAAPTPEKKATEP